LKETLKHKETFEQYYVMGNDRSLKKLLNKLDQNWIKTGPKIPSLHTLKTWSKAFNWQERVDQRDIEIGKKLPAKTNETVLSIKANYRAEIKDQFNILKKMLNKVIEKFKDNKGIEIKDVTGLKDIMGCHEKLIKMDLTLIGEVSKIEEIGLRDAEEKFFNKINSFVATGEKGKSLKRNKKSKQ